MATIVFCMLPSMGHLNPTFKIAKGLKDRGHRVYYLSIPNDHGHLYDTYIQSQGFEVIPLPLHGQEEHRSGNKHPSENRVLTFGRVLSRFVEEFYPGLVLVDPLLVTVALKIYELGVPVVTLSVVLPRRRGLLNPPLSSTIIPRGAFLSSMQIAASWYRIALRRFISRTLSRLARAGDPRQNILQMAKRANYPAACIRFDAVFCPELGLPELIMCAQEFDFPRCPPVPYYHYIGSWVDINRDRDNPFPWDRLDQNKPLIFCTLGSRSSTNPYSRRFFQAVIDAFASRPDWQLILALGEEMDAHQFIVATSNIILVDWAPHLEVLKRASLMVNHGGMGTVKECIATGVPIIAFPTTADQPGNAARIVYHKLGMKGDIRKVTAEQIRSMIETILGDSSYRERVEAMGQKFRESETSGRGVELVESFLPLADRICSVEPRV